MYLGGFEFVPVRMIRIKLLTKCNWSKRDSGVSVSRHMADVWPLKTGMS